MNTKLGNDECLMTNDELMPNGRMTKLHPVFDWLFVIRHSFVIGHSAFVIVID
jgi:hypothetical protein